MASSWHRKCLNITFDIKSRYSIAEASKKLTIYSNWVLKEIWGYLFWAEAPILTRSIINWVLRYFRPIKFMSEIEELQIVGYHVDSVIGKNILDNTNVLYLWRCSLWVYLENKPKMSCYWSSRIRYSTFSSKGVWISLNIGWGNFGKKVGYRC